MLYTDFFLFCFLSASLLSSTLVRTSVCVTTSQHQQHALLGAKPIGTGHVGGALYTTVSGQVNIGHTAPTVRVFFSSVKTTF